MYLCDICSKQSDTLGTLITSDDMKKAVLGKQFDPFKLNIASPTSKFRQYGPMAYNAWIVEVVGPDNTDWNICSNCLSVLQKYL